MRLSEAIRLGAMLKPQCFGGLWINDGSCALGAAYDATGAIMRGMSDADSFSLAIQAFPILEAPQGCPCCRFGNLDGDVARVVAHLNDWHRWTREQIADWVETLEAADERSVLPKFADAVARTAETVTG